MRPVHRFTHISFIIVICQVIWEAAGTNKQQGWVSVPYPYLLIHPWSEPPSPPRVSKQKLVAVACETEQYLVPALFYKSNQQFVYIELLKPCSYVCKWTNSNQLNREIFRGVTTATCGYGCVQLKFNGQKWLWSQVLRTRQNIRKQ